MPATVLTAMKLSIVIHKTGCIGGGGFLVGENNTTLAGREHCSLYSSARPASYLHSSVLTHHPFVFFSLDSGLRRHFKLFTGVILNTSAHFFRYAAALTYFNIWLVSSPVLRSRPTTGELMLCAISKHWCRGWLTRTGDHTLPRIPIAVIVDVTAHT